MISFNNFCFFFDSALISCGEDWHDMSYQVSHAFSAWFYCTKLMFSIKQTVFLSTMCFSLHNIVIKQRISQKIYEKIHLSLNAEKSAKIISKLKIRQISFYFFSLFIQPPRQEHLKILPRLDKTFSFTIAHFYFFNFKRKVLGKFFQRWLLI